MLPPSLLLWIFKICLHCNNNPRVVNGLPGVFASMAKGGGYGFGHFFNLPSPALFSTTL